jgi:hypothetical protein
MCFCPGMSRHVNVHMCGIFHGMFYLWARLNLFGEEIPDLAPCWWAFVSVSNKPIYAFCIEPIKQMSESYLTNNPTCVCVCVCVSNDPTHLSAMKHLGNTAASAKSSSWLAFVSVSNKTIYAFCIELIKQMSEFYIFYWRIIMIYYVLDTKDIHQKILLMLDVKAAEGLHFLILY